MPVTPYPPVPAPWLQAFVECCLELSLDSWIGVVELLKRVQGQGVPIVSKYAYFEPASTGVPQCTGGWLVSGSLPP